MKIRFSVKTLILCIVYGCLLTGALLYMRFPKSEFKDYCCRVAEAYFPESECSIGDVNYTFPLTLRAENIQLVSEEDPESVLLQTQSLSVSPNLGYPLDRFSVKSDLYGGTAEGELIIGETQGAFSLKELEVNSIDLEQLTLIQEDLERAFTGELGFTGEYSGNLGDLYGGAGKGKISIKKGSMELLQPILTLNQLNLRNAAFDLVYKDKELQVEEGKFSGKELRGTFSGTVEIDSPWLRSELDLAGEMGVETSFFAGNTRMKRVVNSLQKRHNKAMLPFNVGGPVLDPVFRFGK